MATKKTETTEAIVTTEEIVTTKEIVAAEAAEESETAETVKTVKVKVVRMFKDKNTGKLHRVGEVMEITEDRYTEIMKVGKLLRKV